METVVVSLQKQQTSLPLSATQSPQPSSLLPFEHPNKDMLIRVFPCKLTLLAKQTVQQIKKPSQIRAREPLDEIRSYFP
jgi:hypothetical protein